MKTNARFVEVLHFIKAAPANILRRLSKQLMDLTRKLFSKKGIRWRITRLPVGDTIRFEDALGTKLNLPVDYYRHWVFFRLFLSHMFIGLPGHYQVRRGQFCLFLERARRVVDQHNWADLIQSGERIKMSVISMIPSEAGNGVVCPACRTKFPGDGLTADNFSSIACAQCKHVFGLSPVSLPDLVTPSDGDRRPVSMLKQKARAWRCKDETVLQTSVLMYKGDELPEHDAEPQPNLGVSKLKHIIVQPTAKPNDIADCIEALLDQILTLERRTDSKNDLDVVRLRTALRLIRDESRCISKLTYFDFESEHKDFMTISRGVAQNLHSCINALENDNAIPTQTAYWIKKLVGWVRNHYSSSNDPFEATIQNDTDSSSESTDSRLVILKTLTGNIRCFRLPLTLSIQHFKHMITKREGVPVGQQYLVYQGRKLEDHLTVGHYGLGPRYYVHVLLPIWYSKRHRTCESEMSDDVVRLGSVED